MRKFGVVASTIFISAILAGLYGIIHDQVTYSISTEYFTKFKYIQFGLDTSRFGGDRQTVAVIGFLATWWIGIIIGLGLGLTGLIYSDHKAMRRAIKRGIVLVFCVAVLTGFVGYFYGKLHLVKTGVSWWLPDNLVSKDDFIVVGSIHNFSYLGGLLGLISGIIYLIMQKKAKQVMVKHRPWD
jgi:hypothetical protein